MTALCIALAFAATPWTTARTDEAAPAELARPVRDVLSADPVEVRTGDRVLTVWLRAKFPVTASEEQAKNGLTLREVPSGTLMGAARFDAAFTDYRKQSIPAGVYTLRSATQPDTGDHAGTAPHPDFLLLIPAKGDTGVESLDPGALVKASRGATAGDHPGVMLAWPTPAGPLAVLDKAGARVLRLSRPAEGVSGTLTFGLTVDGHSVTR